MSVWYGDITNRIYLAFSGYTLLKRSGSLGCIPCTWAWWWWAIEFTKDGNLRRLLRGCNLYQSQYRTPLRLRRIQESGGM